MTPRLQIAAQIYAQLVMQDLGASIDNPARNAHRALLFADALLLCDQQSAPVGADSQAKAHPNENAHASVPGHLADRIQKRRDSRPSLH